MVELSHPLLMQFISFITREGESCDKILLYMFTSEDGLLEFLREKS